MGGAVVDAWTSFAHDGVLTLTPKAELLPDTTYEVVVPEGGIKDAAGNGIEGLSFSFSTGSSVTGGNRAPDVDSFEVSPAPVSPGQAVDIVATGSDPENDPIEYRFNFGDGTPTTAWSGDNDHRHTYSEPGHFEVKVQIRDLKPDGTRSTVTETRTLAVARTPPGPVPTHSSSIAVDEAGRRVWVVNPDHGTIGRLDADTGALLGETGFGEGSRPVSVAIDDNGRAWVALAGADGIGIVDPTGSVVGSLDTGYGSSPQAIAVNAPRTTWQAPQDSGDALACA